MIKLTLTIDEEFDKDDLVRVINANEAYDCIDEIMMKLTSIINHGYPYGHEISEEELEIVMKLEKEFLEIIEDLPGRL